MDQAKGVLDVASTGVNDETDGAELNRSGQGAMSERSSRGRGYFASLRE